ncbi:MAG: hypothetical protein BWK80_62465 [Desulfobacteraceae bacterium IS3]|nr:MAG: hypothetical protein BWK80_62465 [Desulfobacteraceae bacterium IS3]
MIPGVRVIAEHVIAGVKRSRIIRDIFRNTEKNSDDPVHNAGEFFRGAGRLKRSSQPVFH